MTKRSIKSYLILRQMHRMDPNWYRLLQSQSYKLKLLYAQPFSSYSSFWDRCIQLPPKCYSKVQGPHMCCIDMQPRYASLLSPSPKSSICSELKVILRQAHRMTPNDFENYKGERYPIWGLQVTPPPKKKVQNLSQFCFMTCRFRVTVTDHFLIL